MQPTAPILAGALAALLAGPAAAVTVTATLDPARPEFRVGESFALVVGTEDFPSFQSGGLDILFDPAVIRYDGFDFDDGFPVLTRDGTVVIDPVSGLATVDDISFDTFPGPALSSGSEIGTAGFTVIGPGTGEIALAAGQNPFFDANDMIFTVESFGSVSVSAAQIPLPASLPMLLLGLGAAALLGRGRSRD